MNLNIKYSLNEDQGLKQIKDFIFDNIDNSPFREYLVAVSSELLLNARDHGGSPDFKIQISGNKILIEDNGSEYNLFRKEIHKSIQSTGGSHTAKMFALKFSGDYELKYTFKDGNQYQFEFNKPFKIVSDNATCRVEFDPFKFGRIITAAQVKIPKNCGEVYINFIEGPLVLSGMVGIVEFVIKNTPSDTIINIDIGRDSIADHYPFQSLSPKIKVHYLTNL